MERPKKHSSERMKRYRDARDAVYELADTIAADDGRRVTTPGDAAVALTHFQGLRNSDPDTAAKHLALWAAQARIREQMGERWRAFDKAFTTAYSRAAERADMDRASARDDLDDSELRMYVLDLNNRIVSEAGAAVLSNPFVRKIFEGDDALLEEAVRIVSDVAREEFKQGFKEVE